MKFTNYFDLAKNKDCSSVVNAMVHALTSARPENR